MDIIFGDKRLKNALEDESLRTKRYGHQMSKKLGLRLDALAAAECLGDFWPPMSGPERTHVLKGKLAQTYSMDLKHPYRLLFRPAHLAEVLPPTSEPKQLWHAIRSIEILGIEDTHG